MSSYFATVRWTRGTDEFLKQQYSRGHTWQFDEGLTVPASASPHVVKPQYAVAAAVDPEEALVAAVSSCQMLFSLSYFSKHNVLVESYVDTPEGVMEKRADGKMAITRVVLRPVVTVSAGSPSAELFAQILHDAHAECYIANSVNFPVTMEPQLVVR
jgi:organic hydroperoxide reductase OsmC/OhrA